MVDGLAPLVWLANQAAVELHPFLWSVEAPRRPTALVFDLDPGAPADAIDAARVALRMRELLAGLGLVSFAKTSGSLGLHLHVPLGKPHPPATVKEFARAVAEVLAAERPDEIAAEMRRAGRAGKVFVDWLQNDPGRQTVAPYSLRGVPWPTVATPVRWEEIEQAVERRRPELLTFLAGDVRERLERDGDLFEPLLDGEQTLPGTTGIIS